MRNYYKILGVPESATDAEIRTAYRRLAALYHPDHNPHDPQAMNEMKMINEAYDVLSDAVKRNDYDRIHTVHAAQAGPHTDGFNGEAYGPRADGHRSPPAAPQHDPFNMSDDQTPRHPENLAAILGVMEDLNRDRITPFMKRVLWIDVFVSIGYLAYYYGIRRGIPVLAPGMDFHVMYGRPMTSWMTHFALAAHLELITACAAIYWMKRTGRSQFLGAYLFSQCSLNVSVVAAFFGMAAVAANLLVPAAVLVWKVFLIGSLFISRMDQYLWGPR